MEGTEDRKGFIRWMILGMVESGELTAEAFRALRSNRDMFGRPVAEIDGQGVLGNFGQALTDRKRLTERVFETSFSFSKSSCPVRPILLTH